jgi:hypothetical protein
VSYLERLAVIHRWQPSDFRPFLVDGREVGRVRHDFTRLLVDFPKVFRVDDEAVVLTAALDTVDARSAAVHDVVETLAARGDIRPPRGETYGVSECWSAPDRLRIDRGAVPVFGIRAYGVHVNGFVRASEGMKLWVGTRAKDKRVAPGKLDHMVAGGLSHGYSVGETLVKEAAEEAAVPEALARQAVPVGALSYVCEAGSGLRNDTLFIFDLEVPADFTPENTDGELTRFDLWSMERAMERVHDTEDFKFNVGPVMVDFFLRHGFIHPDRQPDYPEIAAALHGMRV